MRNSNVRFLISRTFFVRIILLAAILAGCDGLNPNSLPTSTVSLPYDISAISFDDLEYDARLGKLIVPAAETGTLALIDPINPTTTQPEIIEGFSKQTDPNTPVVGTTSAIVARGMLFALDRDAQKLYMIDPASHKFISSAPVATVPDYVRYVSATNEVWVTEKALSQIEVFPLDTQNPPNIGKPTTISVPNGPEALLIDRTRGLAYTNQPKNGTTAVIQVMTHHIIYEWGNGCSKSRGMAIDEDRGFLFVVCNEGKLVIMDVNNDGLQITSQTYGGGLDFVSYNPALQHVYVASGKSAVLAIFEVVETPIPTNTPGTSPATETPTAVPVTGAEDALATPIPGPKISLLLLGTADTTLKASCVTSDDHNDIWVCNPNQPQLFLIHDTFPPSGD